MYNGDGDRLSQTENGQTTHYTLELNAGLTQVLSDGSNTYLYGHARIAQQSAAGKLYFLSDALGSVRQLFDADGNMPLAKDYSPYGESLSSIGETSTSYGFTGEWTDDTGLVFLRARYYAPEIGLFTSRDLWSGEIYRPMSYNAWMYVYANPTNLTDPSGMCLDRNQDGMCDRDWECHLMPSPYREWCLEELGCGVPYGSEYRDPLPEWQSPSRLRRLTEEEKLVLTLFALKESSQRNYGVGHVALLIPYPAQYTQMKIWALLNKASFDADKINERVPTTHGVWTIYVSWHGEETDLISDTLGPQAKGFDPNNYDKQFTALVNLAKEYKNKQYNEEPENLLTTSKYFSIVEHHVNEIEPEWYVYGPHSVYDSAWGGIGYIDTKGLCKDGYDAYPNNNQKECEAYATEDDMLDHQFMIGFQKWFAKANYARVTDVFEIGHNDYGQVLYNFIVFQKP